MIKGIEWVEWEGDGPKNPELRKLYKEGKLPILGDSDGSGEGDGVAGRGAYSEAHGHHPEASPGVKETSPPSSPESNKSKKNNANKDTPLGRFFYDCDRHHT